jgi:hypothetical protein
MDIIPFIQHIISLVIAFVVIYLYLNLSALVSIYISGADI